MQNIFYITLEMQQYLKNKELTLRQKKLIFRLKTRMTKVGFNFGRKVTCPLCQLHDDNQEGILECIILKLRCKELYMKTNEEQYPNLFSKDINKISKLGHIYQKCFEIREELLDQTKVDQ